jgi:hypothetical protein
MRTGQCQCGAVRYESTGDIVNIYVCHCRECQKQSSSAFGISVEVPSAGLRVTRGSPKFWGRDTDSGKRIRCAFCPDCGSRLWHESDRHESDRNEPDRPAPTLTLKGGLLDVAPDLSSAIHIWTRRMLPGVVIPEGVRQYPGEPPE